MDPVAWAKNRTKSKVRAKVEHVFQVMKLKFGFVKVRYRGLKKNAHRLFVTRALVNLFVRRKRLLLAAAKTPSAWAFPPRCWGRSSRTGSRQAPRVATEAAFPQP